jgi:CheY-like chemotaxis protein
MRSRGIDAIICGLSANDKEIAFRQAGADGFLLKPFSTDQATLAQQVLDLINDGIDRLKRQGQTFPLSFRSVSDATTRHE